MKKTILGIACALTLFTACKKDNNDNKTESSTKYAMMVMTDLSTNSGILFSSNDLPSGTVNVNTVTTGKQLGETRNGGITFGNAVYTGSNSAGESGVQKYTANAAGQLVDAGFISSSAALYNTKFHIISDQLGFYSDGSSTNLKIQIFNPSTMKRTGEIDLSVVSKKASNPAIAVEKVGERMIVSKEGKLYVDVQYDVNNNGFGSSAYDAVYVAVINIATSQFEKLITYNQAQEVSYSPLNMEMARVDANGDLYIATMGNMVSATRNAKILRIKKGQTEFDQTWDINIDNYVAGTGVKWFHGGAAVINGKIITGIKQTPFAADYSNFNEENIVFYAIDINTKVATPIAGVPKTDFVSICTPYVMDGKVWIPYSNTTGSGIYSYDGTTAKEQFKISSGVLSGFYKIGQ